MGYWASKFFTDDGAILVGVAEADGSFICPEGINPDELLAFKNKRRGIKGFLNATGKEGTEYIKDDAIFQEWYCFINLVIFSFPLPSNRPSTEITLINSSANLSSKLPMVLLPEELNKFYSVKESASFPMSSATVVV